MKKLTTLSASLCLLASCSTVEPANDYSQLSVEDGLLQTEQWSGLERFPARYPEKAAMNGEEGCATVEYVISPANEVTNVQIIAASNRHFGKSAKAVVENWKWSSLAKGLTSTPVKTQTRFDFCFESADSQCRPTFTAYDCPGSDVVLSKGIKFG
ncbi:energy transducer TonB [Neiella marina]|nr:energy transducer TonB [Neiella marina]